MLIVLFITLDISWSLTIRNVRSTDAGNYTAVAANRAGSDTLTFSLVVYGKIMFSIACLHFYSRHAIVWFTTGGVYSLIGQHS